jgi:AraC-like DNA-binding protein
MIITCISKGFSYTLHTILLPLLLFACFAVSVAQENDFEFIIPDSLQTKSYEELEAAFKHDKKDSIRRFVYAKTYIAKATKTDDSLLITKGFELLGFAYNHDYKKSFVFYDKGIAISKNLKDTLYPATFYTYKGAILSEKGHYKEALENHLKAIEYAELNTNESLLFSNKFNIGILKKHLELYDEALQLFKECYLYELNNPNVEEGDFLKSNYYLADMYTITNRLDSAKKYNAAGYKIARKLGIPTNAFAVNAGIIFFHQKEYQRAITAIDTAMDSLSSDLPKYIVMNGFFYTAKAYDSLQQKEKAIDYYKKVDSVFTKYPYNFSSNLIKSYNALHAYYEKRNDKANALKYIKKELLAYNIQNEDYLTLNATIKKTFDRRELLEKQKELSNALNETDKKYAAFKSIAWIVSIIFMLVLIGFYMKQRQIKKRFQEFVKNHEKAQEIVVDTEEAQKIGLADDIITQLLSSLDDFETNYQFIAPDITLPSLSKQFKTNSAYLSKVINTYKNKKFAAYLNDLRVDYAIEKIRSDKHFQLYTIKAIALEVGFNNSQSFARAFKRRTGIKPSDFIKQIEKL